MEIGRDFNLRDEVPADHAAVDAVVDLAFDGHPYSDGSEGPILWLLRSDGDLTVGLVAEVDGFIIGQVALSPAQIGQTKGDWFGLGPVSVHPKFQRQGIGRALVAEACQRLRAMGAAGCVLVGEPQVYHPMGFSSEGRVTYMGIDRIYVHWKSFGDAVPEGEITFAPAFTEWSMTEG